MIVRSVSLLFIIKHGCSVIKAVFSIFCCLFQQHTYCINPITQNQTAFTCNIHFPVHVLSRMCYVNSRSLSLSGNPSQTSMMIQNDNDDEKVHARWLRGRLLIDISLQTPTAVSLSCSRFFRRSLFSASVMIRLRSRFATPIRDVCRQ